MIHVSQNPDCMARSRIFQLLTFCPPAPDDLLNLNSVMADGKASDSVFRKSSHLSAGDFSITFHSDEMERDDWLESIACWGTDEALDARIT